MICLYAADESLFEHNGLGILDNDLKKCHVEEVLNNLYTLTAQYPLWAKFGKSIRNGMIIKAPTPNGDQLFRIYQSKPSMGMLEIHAFHIFYDLAFNFVEDTNIVSKSGQAWLQQLSQNTQYSHPFTFFSDISAVAGSRVVRKNCVEILLNTSLDNSFVNRFGGEILRDNFNVYFNRAIGENRGFKIRHKKNLKGYTANIDDKSVITRIMPIGFDGLLLPEKYVDSPRISDYPFPRIGKVEVDVKAAVGENTDAKDAIPLNEAYTKMRALIKEQFGVIDVPTCSYEVDFVELSTTKEYADFQNLETVRIGDTVTVSHDEDGFYVEAKVIRYEYDSLAGRLLRIEAGQFESRSSNNSINQQRSIEQQLEDVKIETSNMVQVAANGKNTIYRGVDRPTNANVGDLWYEPLENSVVLKQWSGVDWELIPISDQNLGNVNVNNLSGNHIDVRRFRISSGDRDILYVNEAGEVILNAKRIQIDFTDVATKTDLQEIELTPGPQGAPGVGITSTVITYARSTSGTSAPTSGWTSEVPSVPAGEFLWTKTIWNYSDSTSETGYSVARMGADGTGLLTTWTFYKLSNSTSAPQVVPIGPSTNLGHLGPNNAWAPYKELSGGAEGWSTIDFDKIAKSDIIPDRPFTWYLEASFDGVSNFNGSTDFNIRFENWYVNSSGAAVYNSLGIRDFIASNFSATNDTTVNNYFSQSITWTVPREVYDAIPEGGFLNLRIRIDRFTKLSYRAKNSYVTYGTVPSDFTQRGLGNYSTYGWKASPEAVTQALPYLWIYQIHFYDNGREVAIPPTLIGTQGADGRTSYIHWAYSDNADGTGLTSSDNGQRYIGHYSDYMQEDSTDKTKYRWADRWAKIEAGNGNLLRWTTVSSENLKYFIKSDSATLSIEHKEGKNAYKIAIANSVPNTGNGAFFNSNENPDGQGPTFNLYPNCRYTFTFSVWSSVSIPFNYGSLGHHQVIGSSNVSGDIAHQHRDASWSVSSIKQGEWQRVSYSFTAISLSYFRPFFGTKDNVSQIRITYDRIAMYSAGKEVMYISQGVIHIDNGVFTKSLQIGRFRTEQHQTNLDINVCRYVG
ncbi:phage tail spike protein [Streptococcus sp. VTCC 12905]|uniref:phage tail spike protein n=1 Tax=Streptococcus sp. VTCC 12905 TaxID=3413768 RepID=UPI003D9C6EAC